MSPVASFPLLSSSGLIACSDSRTGALKRRGIRIRNHCVCAPNIFLELVPQGADRISACFPDTRGLYTFSCVALSKEYHLISYLTAPEPEERMTRMTVRALTANTRKYHSCQ